VVLPAGTAKPRAAKAAPRREKRGAAKAAAASGNALVSPMQGTIVKVMATDGDDVTAGATIVVLEAMKMEQPLTAHKAGTIVGMSAQVGATVAAGTVICEIKDPA
ncbi:biotin/lipoyl-containing protein, partial [Nonomuraea angiospora]